jgi:hypothetical protein
MADFIEVTHRRHIAVYQSPLSPALNVQGALCANVCGMDFDLKGPTPSVCLDRFL